jgi:hypothetical protein
MNTPTPETGALTTYQFGKNPHVYVLLDDARKLERERDEAREMHQTEKTLRGMYFDWLTEAEKDTNAALLAWNGSLADWAEINPDGTTPTSRKEQCAMLSALVAERDQLFKVCDLQNSYTRHYPNCAFLVDKGLCDCEFQLCEAAYNSLPHVIAKKGTQGQ